MRTFLFYIVLLLVVLSAPSSIAQEAPKHSKKAKSIYNSWVYHNNLNNFDSSMYYGDEYVKLNLKFGTDSSIVDAYNHKIRSLKQFRKLNDGLKLALITYEKYCENRIDMSTCKSCNPIKQHLAEFMITLRDYRKGINYLNMECDPNGPALNFYMKARIYSLLEIPDSAKGQTLESIRVASAQNKPRKLVDAYNQHGLITKNLGQYDDAIIAFTQAIKVIDSLGLDESKYGYLVGNLGSCYYEQGDFDEAYKYLQIDADKSKKRDVGSYLNAEIMLAEIDLKREDHKLALLKLDGLMKEYETNLISSQKLSILELYMLAFQASGNRSKYEFYLNQWINLTKSEASSRIETNQILIEGYAANALEQVILQIETEKELLNQKLIIKEQEERESRVQKWLLAGGALLIILIILFFLSRYRKKVLLKEMQLKLANKEQENQKIKSDQLTEELGHKNKDLTDFAIDITRKHEFIQDLLEKLKVLKKVSGTSSNEINDLINYTKGQLLIDKNMKLFQENVDKVNHEFLASLAQKYPNLTANEKQICGLLRLQLSSKEIATIKNISPDSVKVLRSRLRKKLNLSPGTDLQKFVVDL